MIQIQRRAAATLALAGAAVILAGVLWRTGIAAQILRANSPLQVRAVGHTWWWEFDYPELGLKTANELHLPAGRPVRLELVSVDVLHTLSIPELSVLADAVPGTTLHVDLPALGTGQYGGECSQICGLAHNMMRVKVVVESEAGFHSWVAAQQAPAAVPESEQQWRGYEMMTTACAKCHSLDPGERRTDLLGPNLAHLMSRSVFAGATFELNETNLRRWLRDTQAMKAGNDMLVNLPRDDYEAVMEYLLLLR